MCFPPCNPVLWRRGYFVRNSTPRVRGPQCVEMVQFARVTMICSKFAQRDTSRQTARISLSGEPEWVTKTRRRSRSVRPSSLLCTYWSRHCSIFPRYFLPTCMRLPSLLSTSMQGLSCRMDAPNAARALHRPPAFINSSVSRRKLACERGRSSSILSRISAAEQPFYASSAASTTSRPKPVERFCESMVMTCPVSFAACTAF